MNHDDIDSIVLALHDFLIGPLKCNLDENDDYVALQDFMYAALDPFVTNERNFN